ncbi:putative cell division protein Fic [Paenibacillus agaridevorans]|uniref:Putative cell division protein Fic n=1 Tax=Paenibacillus agaridevorans TaxID=171404 RepID=A0A2R5F4J4_9BACL|nr:putative cell division protein Fic [Paenibacillus agaridevorans]
METATYIPPQPQLVDTFMNNLEIYINDPDVNTLYDHDLDLAQSLINSSGVKKSS